LRRGDSFWPRDGTISLAAKGAAAANTPIRPRTAGKPEKERAMAKPTNQSDRVTRAGQFASEATHALDPTSFAANLEPFFHAGTKLLDSWRVVSDELLEFGKARLSRSIEMGRRVTQSASLDQAIEAQADFARSTMQDYIAETGKLAELGTRALVESFSAWKMEAERTPVGRAAQRAEAEAEALTSKHSMAAE
jgi:hypothetical protein